MDNAPEFNYLQHYRKLAGFKSAKAFAEHIGMNPHTYTNYEQGVRPFTFDDAKVFARALGCSLDELAGYTTSYDHELIEAVAATRDALEKSNRLLEKAAIAKFNLKPGSPLASLAFRNYPKTRRDAIDEKETQQE